MLCPVRALKLYVDCSKVWRKSSQLLVCFGAGRCGLATSKQRISHWVRDVFRWLMRHGTFLQNVYLAVIYSYFSFSFGNSVTSTCFLSATFIIYFLFLFKIIKYLNFKNIFPKMLFKV